MGRASEPGNKGRAFSSVWLGKPGKNRGVALIATLVFIFILTTIVVIFLGEVEDRVQYRAQTAGNQELREIAYDYLEFTLGILAEFQEYDSPFIASNQGWGDPLNYEPFPIEYDGLVATVKVEDATNKIPLNALSEEDFVILLESVGVDAFTGARLRDLYFDWIDSDDDTRLQGAETREYELQRRMAPLTPANAELTDIDDFQYILGYRSWIDPQSDEYNPELYTVFTSLLTVDHNYPVNLNVASPGILAFFKLLYRMDPEGIMQYQAGADQVLGTLDDRMIDLSDSDPPSRLSQALGDASSSSLFASEAHVLKVSIDLQRYDTYGFHLEALIDLSGAVATPSAPTGNATEDSPTETSEETNSDDDSERDFKTDESGVGRISNSRFEVLVIRENL